MTRRVLSQVLAAALGGLSPCFAIVMDPGCDGEMTGIKGEVKVLSPDITGVKVEVNVSPSSPAQAPPSIDERAGQKGATEYEGVSLERVQSGECKSVGDHYECSR